MGDHTLAETFDGCRRLKMLNAISERICEQISKRQGRQGFGKDAVQSCRDDIKVFAWRIKFLRHALHVLLVVIVFWTQALLRYQLVIVSCNNYTEGLALTFTLCNIACCMYLIKSGDGPHCGERKCGPLLRVQTKPT